MNHLSQYIQVKCLNHGKQKCNIKSILAIEIGLTSLMTNTLFFKSLLRRRHSRIPEANTEYPAKLGLPPSCIL